MKNEILRYFDCDHLPAGLRGAAQPICDLAKYYDDNLDRSAECSAGLRKLLEAKDCFVRAKLIDDEKRTPKPDMSLTTDRLER